MNTEAYLIITIISAIIFIGTAIFLICYLIYLRKTIYNDFVLQHSISLKKLNELNQHYIFYPKKNFDQSYTYDNENFFNSISCKDYLIYQLKYIKHNLFEQINKINYNNLLYSEYSEALQSILHFGHFDAPVHKLKSIKLLEIEHKLIEKNIYSPCTHFYLRVTLYCSNIHGQVYLRKSDIFSASEIVFLNNKLKDMNGAFYNDREIWDALCRVERGKVSNKMRFLIYKRDGYKCRKCGVSDKYAPLEIDHIIPISKGGKSTYDNLQTLCHKCNVEKGTTIHKY